MVFKYQTWMFASYPTRYMLPMVGMIYTSYVLLTIRQIPD